jgi:[ribosomal protein S5]-alanine N-acetyltransferase
MPLGPLRHLTSETEPSRAPGTFLFETERLIMRRLHPADAPALAEAGNHPEVAVGMSNRFPSPYLREDALEFIESTFLPAQPAPITKPILAGIFLKPQKADDGSNPAEDAKPTLIGSMGLTPGIDIHYRTFTLGYMLGPSAWGKGFMTEAVTGYLRWAFTTWPALVRIDAGRYSTNEASGRVLTKVGFVQEGVRRNAVDKNGELLDEVMYGLQRSDLGL